MLGLQRPEGTLVEQEAWAWRHVEGRWWINKKCVCSRDLRSLKYGTMGMKLSNGLPI